jgi:hypothetical protein
VSVLGDECTPNPFTLLTSKNPAITLQIYENYTFTIKFLTATGTNPIVNAEAIYFGNWQCCNGIFCGVCVQGFPQSLGACANDSTSCAHYQRISIEICPGSKKMKYRSSNLAVEDKACISDLPAECITRSDIVEVRLQRINNVCEIVQADFAPVIED